MINLVINGVSYPFPQTGDKPYGDQVTAWATAVTNAVFPKSGLFTLTGDIDFGASFGLKSTYYKSRSSNIASAGQIRLSNSDTIKFRNAANSADLSVGVDGSNNLTFGGTKITLSGAIVNADISASAAIAYSKLALTGSIVNADVSASAAIAYSKLALTGSIVNADVSASAAIGYSKLALTGSVVNADVSASAAIAYSKLNLTGGILNADINASAAIALSKLATTTASRALVSTAGGVISPASTTATEIGYVSGVTSAIQTQIDAKAPSASPSFTGGITFTAGSGVAFDVVRSVTDGSTRISGSTVAASGGAIYLYGSTHATKASQIELTQGGTVYMTLNSGGAFTFGGSGATSAVTFNSASLSPTSSSTGGTRLTLINTDTGGETWVLNSTGSGDVNGAGNLNFFNSTDNKTYGRISGSGGWNIGESGGTATHSINGSVGVTAVMGVGTTASAGRGITVANAALTGTDQIGVGALHTASSASTGSVTGFQANPATAASAFTTATMAGFNAGAFTKGSGSTITRAINYYGVAQSVGTNNAFLADNSAFSGNYFINQSGTTTNKFGGTIQAGDGVSSTASASTLTIAGGATPSDGGRVTFYGSTHASKASKIELVSNGVTFTLPTADGSTGQFLKTDGSGNLAFSSATTPGVNYQISSSSGAFTSGSVTFVDITNLSVSITSTGRPVIVMIVPDGNGSSNQSRVGSTASGTPSLLRVLRGATEVSRFQVQPDGSASPLQTFDVPAAGTYTYKVQGLNSGGSLICTYVKLVAYEL